MSPLRPAARRFASFSDASVTGKSTRRTTAGRTPPPTNQFAFASERSPSPISAAPLRSGYTWRMAKYSAHILELAKRGADSRFRELLDELKVLTLSFPHLRDAFGRDDLPVKFLLRQGRDKTRDLGPARRRRKMSAAARKAIGDAQRARWAKQKAAAAKK